MGREGPKLSESDDLDDNFEDDDDAYNSRCSSSPSQPSSLTFVATASSPSPEAPKTPHSRIPVRTASTEKRAREAGQLGGHREAEAAEGQLSPAELKALRAERKREWRQARLKSLEQSAEQIQSIIQAQNAVNESNLLQHQLKEDKGNKNEVETCQEKIISIELQDPSRTSAATPSDEENPSIITVQCRSEGAAGPLEFVVRPGKDATDARMQYTPMQTIVEVVNPILGGRGAANTITVGRSSDDYPSFDEETAEFEANERYELSLNDKMKNVLQELLENEKVKLNRSRSMTESDNEENPDEDDEDDESENGAEYDCVFRDHEGNNSHFGNGFPTLHELDEENSNQIDQCQVISNPNTQDDEESTQEMRQEAADEELKERLLSQLNVDNAAGEEVAVEEDEIVANVQDTGLPAAVNSSTNSSKSRKKRKNKNKKK